MKYRSQFFDTIAEAIAYRSGMDDANEARDAGRYLAPTGIAKVRDSYAVNMEEDDRRDDGTEDNAGETDPYQELDL